jgi:tetratricopeptide (TPR) repeat protein
VIAPTRKAFELRGRLTPVERYLAEAYYYDNVEEDRDKVEAAYRAVLDLDPDETTALNNLAVEYRERRRNREAEELLVRAMSVGGSSVHYVNLVAAQWQQGKFAEAESTLARFARELPDAAVLDILPGGLAAAKGEFAAAAAVYASRLEALRGPVPRVALAQLALVRGRVAESERWWRETMDRVGTQGGTGLYVFAVGLARMELLYRADTAQARREIEATLERRPLSQVPPPDRPYALLAGFFADAGRLDVARRLMVEYQREVAEPLWRNDARRHNVAGRIALAEGRYQDAVAAFRLLRSEGTGALVGLAELAEAYDRTGNQDSALAYYERFVSTPPAWGGPGSGPLPEARDLLLGPSYKRLGELHEQRGDRAKAVEYYNKLVELWKEADAELQPVVEDVKRRIGRLVGEGGPP